MKKLGFGFLVVIVTGFLLPQKLNNPVKGAIEADYKNSYWYYPWESQGRTKV